MAKGKIKKKQGSVLSSRPGGRFYQNDLDQNQKRGLDMAFIEAGAAPSPEMRLDPVVSGKLTAGSPAPKTLRSFDGLKTAAETGAIRLAKADPLPPYTPSRRNALPLPPIKSVSEQRIEGLAPSEVAQVDGAVQSEIDALAAEQAKDAAITTARTKRVDAERPHPLPPFLSQPKAANKPAPAKSKGQILADYWDNLDESERAELNARRAAGRQAVIDSTPADLRAEWLEITNALKSAGQRKRIAKSKGEPTNRFTMEQTRAKARLKDWKERLRMRLAQGEAGEDKPAPATPEAQANRMTLWWAARSPEFKRLHGEIGGLKTQITKLRRDNKPTGDLEALLGIKQAEFDALKAVEAPSDRKPRPPKFALTPSNPILPETKAPASMTPSAQTAKTTVAAPPVLTAEGRFKINNFLRDNYASGDTYAEGHYPGDLTDQKVAERLNMPLGWVREIREGYGPDVNEQAAEVAAELAAIREQVGVILRERTEFAARYDRKERQLMDDVKALADMKADASKAEDVALRKLTARLDAIKR